MTPVPSTCKIHQRRRSMTRIAAHLLIWEEGDVVFKGCVDLGEFDNFKIDKKIF